VTSCKGAVLDTKAEDGALEAWVYIILAVDGEDNSSETGDGSHQTR